MPAKFAQLWEENQRRVYRGLLKCGADRADAEDAVAQAGLQAWAGFERFDALRASFATWLGVISYREWLKILNRRRRLVRLDPERDVVGDRGIEDSILRVRKRSEVERQSEAERQSEMQMKNEMQMKERLVGWVKEREAANPRVPRACRKYGIVIEELLERLENGGSLRQVDVAQAVGVDRSTVCRCYAWLRNMVRENNIRSESGDER